MGAVTGWGTARSPGSPAAPSSGRASAAGGGGGAATVTLNVDITLRSASSAALGANARTSP